ncbi:hypothetical protein C8R44DRAFT_881152 [Mycena epipterygia]|nr:hypothetical protein C8R44DRAFT_881152 [Mycena epipterygia]
MKLSITALLPFFAAAIANPIVEVVARNSAFDARDTLNQRNCQIIDLVCNDGDTQAVECQETPFQCNEIGLPPVTSNATCAAQCLCHVC